MSICEGEDHDGLLAAGRSVMVMPSLDALQIWRRSHLQECRAWRDNITASDALANAKPCACFRTTVWCCPRCTEAGLCPNEPHGELFAVGDLLNETRRSLEKPEA